MKNLLTFEEFVNEKYSSAFESNDADGFDPEDTTSVDPVGAKIKTVEDLVPGHEYVLAIDKKTHTDMIYQGATNGVHIFNGEDKQNDVQFTDEEIADLVSKGRISSIVGM